MKRRDFVVKAASASFAAALSGNIFPQTAQRRDVSYEPDSPLESTGLRIRDGVEILKKGELGHIKYKPERFWKIILLFFHKFVRYFPQFAFELLCVKEL